MRAVTGLNFWTSAVVLIVITGLYTVLGGLRAVILHRSGCRRSCSSIGSATLALLGVSGGSAGGAASTPRSPAEFFSMWKPISDPDFPWTGIVFGAPILGIWYWCTDQHIVQRVLAART